MHHPMSKIASITMLSQVIKMQSIPIKLVQNLAHITKCLFLQEKAILLNWDCAIQILYKILLTALIASSSKESRKLMNFIIGLILTKCLTNSVSYSGRLLQECYGQNNFTIMLSKIGYRAILIAFLRQNLVKMAEILNGNIYLTTILFLCPINGNIPGTQLGIWLFI